MAKDTGRRTDHMPIKKRGVSGLSACRQTVTVNHYPGILQVIITGVNV